MNLIDEISPEILHAMAQAARYFAKLLDDIATAHEGQTSAEPVNRKTDVRNLIKVKEGLKKEEPERHKLKLLYERGEIDTYTYNALWRGFMYRLNVKDPCIEDLSLVREKQLKRWNHVGKKTLADVKKAMDVYGVKFRGEGD